MQQSFYDRQENLESKELWKPFMNLLNINMYKCFDLTAFFPLVSDADSNHQVVFGLTSEF